MTVLWCQENYVVAEFFMEKSVFREKGDFVLAIFVQNHTISSQ
jgi:hypothetical protein